MDWLQTIKEITLAVGVVWGIYIGYANRKKISAEIDSVDAHTADQLVKTAMAFIEPLRKELADERSKRQELDTRVSIMATEIAQMRWDNARLMAGVTQLVHQVKSIGHTPVFDPDKDMPSPERK